MYTTDFDWRYTKLIRKLKDKYLVPYAKVAIALSGGADSVCLFYILAEWAKKTPFSLTALHLNHGIRGEEADRDEDFCRKLCEYFKIPFVCKHADVPADAKRTGKSLEEAARDARYSFFSEVMEERGIEVLATAHHADDNAETILLRLIRGTSLDGLCGISEERPFGKGVLIRPLLDAPKELILAFCNKNRIGYVTDSTNKCTDYPRNRIREEIIPQILKINPSFQSAVGRETELLALDSDFLCREAENINEISRISEREREADTLGMVHPAIALRVIRELCISCGAKPEQQHLMSALSMLSKKENSSLSIPGKKRLVLCDGVLSVEDDERERTTITSYEFSAGIGETVFSTDDGKVKITVRIEREEDPSLASEPCVERFPADFAQRRTLTIERTLHFDSDGALTLRSRRAGDKLDFGNISKSLRRVMSEAKVPESLRELLPCIIDRQGLAWVPHLGCAKRCEGEGTLLRVCVRIEFDV